MNDATEIIEAHLEAWNNAQGPHLNAFTGFVSWSSESLVEVTTDLITEDPQLGDDLAYSIRQGDHEVPPEEVMAWILEHKTELLRALEDEAVDSMNDADLRAFREEALTHGDTEGAEICSRALDGSLLDRLDVLGMKMWARAMCD